MIYSKKCFWLKRKLLIILVAQLSLFGACINNYGYIEGPYEVEAHKKYRFQYRGDKVQDRSAMHWEVTQGNVVSNYDGDTMLHAFSENGEEAQIRLFLLNKNGEQRGRALGHKLRINPWTFKIAVLDTGGARLRDIQVGVYSDLACATSQNRKACLIEMQTTNWYGEAVFEKLKRNEEYAVFIRSDLYSSNLDPETDHQSLMFTASQQREDEAKEVMLQSNLLSTLANSKFELIDIKNEMGLSVYWQERACRRDNFVQFDAHLNWRISEGVDSCLQTFAASGSYKNITYFGGFESLEITQINYAGAAFIENLVLWEENNLELNTIEAGLKRSYYFRRIGN